MPETRRIAPSAAAEVTVSLADGRSFPCRPDETILAAALRAGLDASYECASGACGACRCRLRAGEVATLWPGATGISERDRARGDRILACQSVPRGDILVALPAREGRPGPAPESAVAQVAVHERLNAEVVRLVLRLPRAEGFLPGQFYLLDLPGAGRRAYSMANLPNAEGHLEFLVKRKPGGAGTALLVEDTRPGDSLRVEGPYGRAYLRADSPRPIVAVAGGSGLAPVLSVARGALSLPQPRPIALYFGVNTEADLFCREELQALADTGRVAVHTVIRAADTTVDGVRRGLVGEVMAASEGDLRSSDLYVAGPVAMVDDILHRTVRQGLAQADRVFFDRFQ